MGLAKYLIDICLDCLELLLAEFHQFLRLFQFGCELIDIELARRDAT